MNKKFLALYSLKYNPFSPEIPTSAFFLFPPIESFCWRIENQIGEGGFSLVSGQSGTGKSAVLRILADRLRSLPDVTVGILSRPQASVADFYRELGHLFSVPLFPHNRWAGAKALREQWQAHIDASLYRPVLLVDETQEMRIPTLCELRLLSTSELDSKSLLTVILAGDNRLTGKLQSPDLLPLASRIRSRLRIEGATPQQLGECLTHLIKCAGNPRLMTAPLIQTLCEHAAGNLRLLMNMASDLLATAVRHELDQLDEKLFFEVFALESSRSSKYKPS